MENKIPKIGVGVIIIKDNKVLLGKRKNAHGDGTWSFPGGHLEFSEQVEECARREVREETGLEIDNLKLATFTNDIFIKEKKHYVTLYVIGEYFEGKPKIIEPDKCERWEWFEWGRLPQPLFLPVKNLLKTKFNPFKRNR